MKNYTGYDTKEEYEASVKNIGVVLRNRVYDETEDLISACLARLEFAGVSGRPV